MATLTCRACQATIRPPGGRVDGVTRCPWCGADPRADPAAPAPPPPPPTPASRVRTEARPAPPPPAKPRGDSEPLVAAAILAGSAVLAVGAFFAARWLMLAVG